MMLMFLLLALLAEGGWGRTLIDLTHTFDENAPKYPLAKFGVPDNQTYYGLKTISEKWYPDGQW